MRYLRAGAFLICFFFVATCTGHSGPQTAGGTKSPSERAGLPFAWDVVKGNYATPGVSLVIKERERARVGKSTHVTYELRAPGFLAAEEPIMAQRSMNETYARVPLFLFDEKAEVFDPNDPTLLHPSGFVIGNFVLGEALDLALFTKDGAKRAQARVIPFPIEARGNGSCSAFAQAVVTGGRGFAVIGEGFTAGEDVRFHSRYKKEEIDEALRAEDGTIYRVVLFEDKVRGTVTHTLTGSGCSVSLTHKVGKDALAVQ